MEVWRPEVLIPLTALWVAYATGGWRLVRRSPSAARPRLLGRLAAAWGGVVALAVALLGLHDLAHARFSAHMIQHMLLVAVAPPLLLLADPLPAVLWALPGRARRAAGRLLRRTAAPRRVWSHLTRPLLAWPLHVGALWAWHVPALYDWALAHRAAHDVEHVVLFVTAVLFWWAVIAPAPRQTPAVSDGARIAYLLLAAFARTALGLLLVLVAVPLYAYRGADALEDQALGGLLMWGVGGIIDLGAVLLVLARAFGAASLTGPARQARMNGLDA